MIAETEAIFSEVNRVNQAADADAHSLRRSIDAKATVKVETIRRWVINADNGPENSSRRTQFMQRLVAIAQRKQIIIQLAYYPPYHSKYNPVERTFGWLEQHWRGSLLDSVETVVRFDESLTFKGNRPTVSLVTQVYKTGVKLTQTAMADLEKQFHRLPGLEKWFIEITPQPTQ